MATEPIGDGILSPIQARPQQHWGAKAERYSGMDLSIVAWVLLEHLKPHTGMEPNWKMPAGRTVP